MSDLTRRFHLPFNRVSADGYVAQHYDGQEMVIFPKKGKVVHFEPSGKMSVRWYKSTGNLMGDYTKLAEDFFGVVWAN